MRPSGRSLDAMRDISIETNATKHAEGSCIIRCGDTHVLCTASLEERVPPFLRNTGLGWVTAEYGMLPRSTGSRMRREATAGKQGGRTQEIQRLIGRSLRAGVDRVLLGERQITVDCDVLQADGGTRTLSTTGGFIALCDVILSIESERPILRDSVAAVSVGVVDGEPVLDLDYVEDSAADVDMNVIMTGSGRFIEVQGTAEGEPFDNDTLQRLLSLGQDGIGQLTQYQRDSFGESWPLK